ncbi:hypothetical protein MRX96_028255 [Rhipicephalus microplus]
MQPVQGEPQCYGAAERSSVVSPPVWTFHSEWTPSPTWAASSPAELCFMAKGPLQAAALPSDRSFPRYYYEDGSGPVSEKTLDPESLSEARKPSRVEFLSVVLGIAFAKLLLGIRLHIVHNSLSPYDVTPDVTYGAFEQRLEIAPNTVGQRFIPRRVVHPDFDEKGNRRTTTSAHRRVRFAGRATKGRTARLLLVRVMTCAVTTPPVTAATTGAQEEDDVQLRRSACREAAKTKKFQRRTRRCLVLLVTVLRNSTFAFGENVARSRSASCYGDAVRSSVFSPPVRTFHSEWTPLPTWAASSPADL